MTAAYGRYVAASLADPQHVQPEPRIGRDQPEAAIAHAFLLGFKQDLKAASEAAKAAEKQFPRNARVAVFSAQMSLALNDREAMREAVARARELDPDLPDVLLVSGMVRGHIDGEVNRAIAELRKAAAIAPGKSDIWNTIGLFEFGARRTHRGRRSAASRHRGRSRRSRRIHESGDPAARSKPGRGSGATDR